MTTADLDGPGKTDCTLAIDLGTSGPKVALVSVQLMGQDAADGLVCRGCAVWLRVGYLGSLLAVRGGAAASPVLTGHCRTSLRLEAAAAASRSAARASSHVVASAVAASSRAVLALALSARKKRCASSAMPYGEMSGRSSSGRCYLGSVGRERAAGDSLSARRRAARTCSVARRST